MPPVPTTLRRIKKMVPLPVRRYLRRGWLVAGSLNDMLMRRDRMVPWKQYALSVGGGDFEEVGREYLEHFQNLASLKPDEDVLDVGCGIGRLAVPLTGYLDGGTYTGFDIIETSVNWCRKRIGSRFPHFCFDHVNVYNEHYNPKGKLKASEFDFPYADASFDFVFLISVFTHMIPGDLHNYLAEVARVLRPGGRCLITYTLLNETSLRLTSEGKATLNFKFEFDGFRSVERDEPETSIAFFESDIRALYERNGLEIAEPIHFGQWSGRTDGLSFQDIVVASKPPDV
jgi:SAM-dependent methyltransferase